MAHVSYLLEKSYAEKRGNAMVPGIQYLSTIASSTFERHTGFMRTTQVNKNRSLAEALEVSQASFSLDCAFYATKEEAEDAATAGDLMDEQEAENAWLRYAESRGEKLFKYF